MTRRTSEGCPCSSSTPPVRLPWLDEWRGARGHRLRTLVASVAAQVDQHEEQTGLRKRKRRPDDQRRHKVAVEVIVSNLAHAVLMPPDAGRLAILTGNGVQGFTRYDNPAFGKPLRALLGSLRDTGHLVWHSSTERGQASSVAPTPALSRLVHEAGITLTDFDRVPGEEVILLAQKLSRGPDAKRDFVNYQDTAATRNMRSELWSLNDFVAEADINFADDGCGLVDVQARVQRRHFGHHAGDPSISFDRGGRLYGPFWQYLKKERRRGLCIEGEKVALLDFSSMNPRLAYAHVGVSPPETDIYALPGLEGHRPAVKIAMNALLSDDFRGRRSWPAFDDGTPVLPTDWTPGRFKKALLQQHPALRDCLGIGLAHQLQNTESRIMIEVLRELKSRRIVGLGLHDGLMVPASRADEARAVMLEAVQDIARTLIPITVETIGCPV